MSVTQAPLQSFKAHTGPSCAFPQNTLLTEEGAHTAHPQPRAGGVRKLLEGLLSSPALLLPLFFHVLVPSSAV